MAVARAHIVSAMLTSDAKFLSEPVPRCWHFRQAAGCCVSNKQIERGRTGESFTIPRR